MAYTLDILAAKEIPPNIWDAFIHASPQGSLYAMYDYLSLIRKEWQAYVVRKGDQWCAVMPFCLNRKWRFTSLPQPLYSQYWGICFRQMEESPSKQLSLKKQWIQLITEQWEGIHLIVQNFSPAFDYPLPFHWVGCTLHTRYTYHLDLLSTEEGLFQQMEPAHRRKIRQAQKRGLQLVHSQSPVALSKLMAENRRNGHDIVGPGDASYEQLQNICRFLLRRDQGILLEVHDANQKVVAAGIFAHYQEKYLYLAGCQHPDFKSSGAHTLLMWGAIQHAHAQGATIFDFEGSMMEGVEHFFRKFGAQPVPYLQIRRNRLPLPLRWIHASQ